MNRVRLQYYAQLREQAGCSEEALETAASTLAALYAEAQVRHGFALPLEALKVAVNQRFAHWEDVPADGDVVVFIPPVAGG